METSFPGYFRQNKHLTNTLWAKYNGELASPRKFECQAANQLIELDRANRLLRRSHSPLACAGPGPSHRLIRIVTTNQSQLGAALRSILTMDLRSRLIGKINSQSSHLAFII